MDWSPDTDSVHANKKTVLARRERPQIFLEGDAGSSYGRPKVLFTSAQDCTPTKGQADGGTGVQCTSAQGGVGTDMSYTCLAELDLS